MSDVREVLVSIHMQPVVYCDNCGARFPFEFGSKDKPRKIRQTTRAEGWRLARDKEGGGFMDLCQRCQ